MFVLSPFIPLLKVFHTRVQHSCRERAESGSSVDTAGGRHGPEMTRVFNYFTARRKEGASKRTERTAGVHSVEAIYIFSQYSSHSSAVSSVERNTPALSPLFPDPFSLSLFSFSCSSSSHEYRFHVVSLKLAYLLPDSTTRVRVAQY